MNKILDYEINEGTFVIFETLQSLQWAYHGSLPSDVENSLNKLKRVLLKYITPNDNEYRNLDYLKTEYFMRVTYGSTFAHKKNKEQEIYINSELFAYLIAGFLNSKNERYIDHELVYQVVKSQIKDDELIDDVYRATISLLEDKYGILFDLEKKVDI